MRRHSAAIAVTSSVVLCSVSLIGLTSGSARAAGGIGRQTLPANDGFAAADGGTTGGSAATPGHVYVVTTRKQLAGALAAAGDQPRIIYVKGVINANAGDSGKPLTCDDYAAGTGYTLQGYLNAYNPATWGTASVPAGPLEDARAASEANQAKQIDLVVPSNTTIVGLGPGATILGGDLYLDGVNNVIIRNLTLKNAYDCFPQWDPTDTSVGNWNSEFDNITIINNTTHIWVDHNTFTDQPYPDSAEPVYFGRPFQQHDGATDITDGSDDVTVSWNVYSDHDKLMLIGSTNKNTYDDADHLHVTIHHNEFIGVGQRASRLRYGQNDVYDNYYIEPGDGAVQYVYSWGVGVFSHIYAQDNYFSFTGGVTPAQIIYNWGGTEIHAAGNLVNGRPVDVLAAYNAANPPAALSDDTSWTPIYRGHVDPPWAVPALVSHLAGAGRTG